MISGDASRTLDVKVGDIVLIRAVIQAISSVNLQCATLDGIMIRPVLDLKNIASIEAPLIRIGDTVFQSGYRDHPAVVRAIVDDICVVKAESDGEIELWEMSECRRL